MILAFAFVAGVVTILSPCVLPLLPVILASSTLEGRRRPVGLIIGFAAFFTGITLLLSLLVRQFSIPPDVHRTAAALIFVAMGLLLAVPGFKSRFELFASRYVGRFGSVGATSSGFSGGLVTGAGLGLAWTPCVGPIMATVITLALNRETTLSSTLTGLSFSLGTALTMGMFVLFARRLYSRIGVLKRNSAGIQQFLGVFILLVGLGIWFGFDRAIQIAIFRAFPGWDATLNGWERMLTD